MPKAALLSLLFACAQEDYARVYATHDRASAIAPESIAALDTLGATIVSGGVNFSVYSGAAHRLELLLFDDPEAALPARRFPMSRFGNVWNLFVEGVGVGQHYGYVAWGPNWTYDSAWYPGSMAGFVADVDTDGNRFNPNKLLVDPYCRAVHRDHDWQKGSAATGPRRAESTWAAASKCVVVESRHAFGPKESEYWGRRLDPQAPGHRWQDLIIYEVHPKGLTASLASGVDHPGTYRGIGEMADYFLDLGVTAVELMPVHEKPLDGGYWGYQSIGFFMPERSYAQRQALGEVQDEFKWMVEELHRRDIEVILDVVYNHTGEGGLWRERVHRDDVSLDPSLDNEAFFHSAKEVVTIYSFRGLDNAAYYALPPDRQTFWYNTGVGNQTRPNFTPMRRLIRDSLRFWVEEMHVDGFRFDLAPVLGEKDDDYRSWDDVTRTVLTDVLDDTVLSRHNTRIIAEPWSLQGFYLGAFPASGDRAWYEWNGNARDFWRSFINEDSPGLSSAVGPIDAGAALTGSKPLFGDDGRKPYHSVNFITVHDGLTLYDLLSYDQKRNGCGPLNPVCCDEPNSPFCETDNGESYNRSRAWGDSPEQEAFKRQLMRNFFVLLLLSQGTPMMLGGDEWLRTQLGNNNAYSTKADNPFNWFDWGTWRANTKAVRMHDFVRKVIRFRKDNAFAFVTNTFDAAPLTWRNAQGTPMTAADWRTRHLAQHFVNEVRELLVLLNMELSDVSFALPAGAPWLRRIDTQKFFDDDDALRAQGKAPELSGNFFDVGVAASGSYVVPSRAIVVLER